MLCFYCGRLGHGTNECMEVEGDCTPEKKYGASLRASPWKFSQEVNEKEEILGGDLLVKPIGQKHFCY